MKPLAEMSQTVQLRFAVLAAVAALCSACSSEQPPDSLDTNASRPVHVCFELRHGAPLQDGFDFYGYFLDEGRFLPGIDDVQFDSGTARIEIVLAEGVDGQSWVAELPNGILQDDVLTGWSLSDRAC